ncbi:MAG: HAD family phosphatase [Anaerovorax sp.]
MKVKGAIFDLDGTLLDSMFIWDTIGEDYLIHRDITPEKGLNEKFKTMSIVQAADYYRQTYGLTDTIEEIVNGVNEMIDHFYAQVVSLKSGVSELLEQLRADGVKLCVATATDRYMVEAALKRNGILDCFSSILTCTEVGFGKDSPIIFEKALKELGTKKSETLVFEDALHAIETAKNAGFSVAGVYDHWSKSQQNEIKSICDYYITSFKDWHTPELWCKEK